jgi:hypothetical protein
MQEGRQFIRTRGNEGIADFRFHLLNDYTLVDLTEYLIEDAVGLVRAYGLRVYDAVHSGLPGSPRYMSKLC